MSMFTMYSTIQWTVCRQADSDGSLGKENQLSEV